MAGEWNRFTRHAKQAVRESQELAASLGGAAVVPEHLLMTIADDSTSAGSLLLSLLGAPLDTFRSTLEDSIAGESLGPPVEKPSFSPTLKAVVESAGLMAEQGPIGTEHLLVAALRMAGPMAALREACGIKPEELWAQLDLMGSHELALRSAGGASSSPATSPAASRPMAGAGEAPGEPAPDAPGNLAGGAAREPEPPRPAIRRPPEPAEAGIHTVLALARLVVDLAGKASRTAASSGNDALAKQLDTMRQEAEGQIRAARPTGSRPGRAALLDEAAP